MASEQSFWYRVGYALERARQGPPTPPQELAGLTRRARRERPQGGSSGGVRPPTVDDLISSGIVALAGRVLDGWRPARKAGFIRLLRAGAAGAGAALLLDLVRPLLSGKAELPVLDRDTADRVLAGMGQGLLYGAVVEPRVPGPPLMKGALFASAEYATDPVGGLSHLLSAHTPQGRVPIVRHLFEELDPHDRAYLEHLVFGVALALLYGSSPSSNGMRIEVDNE